MSDFVIEKDPALNTPMRPGAIDIAAQQADVFPFDAIEFDDPNKEENPEITVKPPWTWVTNGLLIYADGVDKDNLVVGDRRLYAEGEVLKLQNWTGTAWEDDISLGGYDSNEEFMDLLVARGVFRSIPADFSGFKGGIGFALNGSEIDFSYSNFRPATEPLKVGESVGAGDFDEGNYLYNGKVAKAPDSLLGYTKLGQQQRRFKNLGNFSAYATNGYFSTTYIDSTQAIRIRCDDFTSLSARALVMSFYNDIESYWSASDIRTNARADWEVYLTPTGILELEATHNFYNPAAVTGNTPTKAVTTTPIVAGTWHKLAFQFVLPTTLRRDFTFFNNPNSYIGYMCLDGDEVVTQTSNEADIGTAAFLNGVILDSIRVVSQSYVEYNSDIDFEFVDNLSILSNTWNVGNDEGNFKYHFIATVAPWFQKWFDADTGYWDLYDDTRDLFIAPDDGKLIVSGDVDGTPATTTASGPPGPQGDTGSAGISILWKGSLATAPVTPEENWAYYDTTTKESYIYDGDSWEILAKDGATGDQGIQGIQGIQGPAGDNYWQGSDRFISTADPTSGDGENSDFWFVYEA